MGSVIFDFRDALRTLVRAPGYAATVVLTLAVTIGATAAVFSIVNSVLLEPLAYRDSGRLVELRELWRELPGAEGLPVNERHLEFWREHARSFDAMAQYTFVPSTLTAAGDAVPATVVYASGSLFDVLKVDAARGRVLTPADEPSSAPKVVVIADALWQQRLNGDAAAIGRSIAINGKTMVIVGVLPPGVQLPSGGRLTRQFDAIAPLHADATHVGWAGDHNNHAIGRLRPGVRPEQASAELDVLQRQVSTLATRDAHETVTLASQVTPLAEAIVGRARRGLILLLAAVAAVLLVACANLANLSLSRTLARARESAIRSALGANRVRLVVGTMIEQLLLASTGGAIGVWIAWFALRLFVRTAPIDLPRAGEVALDGRAIAFAAAVSGVAGLLVAALPAWRIGSGDVEATLRSGGTAVASDRGGMRARAALLSVQVALSVVLLAATTLLGVSLFRVLQIDRGFGVDRVAAVGITLPSTRYADMAARVAVLDRLLPAVRSQPGVANVTVTSMLPLSGEGQVNFIVPEGSTRPRSEGPSANFRFVAPAFFRTLGVAMSRGRTFTDAERDPGRPAPVVVSASVARRLWPGEDAIGKRFSRGIDGEQGFEVVGVAVDARTTSLERTPPLMVYVPYWWRLWTSASLLVKAQGDPTMVMGGIRRAVHDIDPEIAVGEETPLQHLVDRATAARRYQTQLFVVFGAVALFIAMVGVYAVTAYSVSSRRREMNIRAALGARRSQVLGMMVRQESVPIAIGIGIGAAGALAAGQFIASLLFEVRARDPYVLASVAAVVAITAIAACTLAARGSLSVDPAAALRE